MLKEEEQQRILSELPNIKLSYENIIHKKVYSDFVLAIPEGKKCFAWFTNNINGNVCYILELGENKQIFDIKIVNCCFNSCLSYGTVFYGTLFNYLDNDFPDSEDLYGTSKALGEIRGMPNGLTLRTSFIGYEIKNKKGFFEWIINSKKEIQGFKKAIYTGFTTIELSKIIYKIIKKRVFLSGLYNVSSYKIDKYELIKTIINVFRLRIKLIVNNKFVN